MSDFFCDKTERIDANVDELVFLSPTYKDELDFMRDMRLIATSEYVLCYFLAPDERRDYINKKVKKVFDLS